jgi:hypothetical protein
MRDILLLAPGVEFDLCAGPVEALAGPQLWGLPPVSVVESESVGGDGGRLIGSRWGTRELLIPVRVRESDLWQVGVVLGELVSMLSTGRVEPGVQRVAEVDVAVRVAEGDTAVSWRMIRCHYVGGLEQLGYGRAVSNELSGLLRLRAVTPFWRTPGEFDMVDGRPRFGTRERNLLTVSVGWDASTAFYGGYDADGPYDEPLTAYPYQATKVEMVTNAGAVDAWPRFRVRSIPGLAPWVAVAVGDGPGWRVDFEGPMVSAVWWVTTRPGNVGVWREDAKGRLQWAFSTLAEGSVFDPIPAGQTVQMTFTRSVGSSLAQVRVYWDDEWLSP